MGAGQPAHADPFGLRGRMIEQGGRYQPVINNNICLSKTLHRAQGQQSWIPGTCTDQEYARRSLAHSFTVALPNELARPKSIGEERAAKHPRAALTSL